MRKGITLIFALISLLLLALLAAAIMMLSMSEGKIVGTKINNLRCLSYAEAGVSEVIHRLSLDSTDSLHIGDSSVPYEPKWKVYILLNNEIPADQPPVYYRRSVQMAISEGKRLRYSTENPKTNYSLIVHHKLNEKKPGEIFFYNWIDSTELSADPITYRGAFLPVEIIESVGATVNGHKKLMVEVAKNVFTSSLTAVLSSNCDIEVSGRYVICGHNHVYSTPPGTDTGENPFQCFVNNVKLDERKLHTQRSDNSTHANERDNYEKESPDLECSKVGCVTGILTSGHRLTIAESSFVRGNPDITMNARILSFMPLHKIFGVESSEELDKKFVWINMEPGKIAGGKFSGIYKCKGDLDISGAVNFDGVLWVTGEIKQKGDFFCKGLVYAGKGLDFDGSVWILGAVAVEDKFHKAVSRFDGSGAILYSSTAVERAVSYGLGYGVILRKEE